MPEKPLHNARATPRVAVPMWQWFIARDLRQQWAVDGPTAADVRSDDLRQLVSSTASWKQAKMKTTHQPPSGEIHLLKQERQASRDQGLKN